MKSYWMDYTNHMLRVFYANPQNLSDAEKANIDAVKSVLDNGIDRLDKDTMTECLAFVYAPPCEDFGARVTQYNAVSGLPSKDIYRILAKVSRELAKLRGLI